MNSDWSKTYVLSQYKTYKNHVLSSCMRKIYIIKQMNQLEWQSWTEQVVMSS